MGNINGIKYNLIILDTLTWTIYMLTWNSNLSDIFVLNYFIISGFFSVLLILKSTSTKLWRVLYFCFEIIYHIILRFSIFFKYFLLLLKCNLIRKILLLGILKFNKNKSYLVAWCGWFQSQTCSEVKYQPVSL